MFMNNIDFENRFRRSIIEKPLNPEGTNSDMLLGRRYSFEAPDEMMPSLLAGGHIESSGPLFYHMRGLGCYIMLYTYSGEARYSCAHHCINLGQSSLLFTDADSEFSIEQTSSDWTFYIGYVSGNVVSTYSRLISSHETDSIAIAPASPVSTYFDQLSCMPDIGGLTGALHVSRLLTCIFTEVCLSLTDDALDDARIPIYIKQMRAEMDRDYSNSFTLEGFEDKYKKNRFRLCREFSKYYGISPMQYLTGVRIAAARHLLTTTDMSVQDIGFDIGMSDTNHFISIFKRINGVTPLSYRRQSSEAPE